jgi:hypothetical protein
MYLWPIIGCRYKKRFIAALPESRKGHADFGRPVFMAVAFFLCAKKNKVCVMVKQIPVERGKKG